MDKHQQRQFLKNHRELTRRYFLSGTAGALAFSGVSLRGDVDTSGVDGSAAKTPGIANEPPLSDAVSKLESWLTLPDDFQDVSRGKPVPHSLDPIRRAEVGLTRDTWKLEVVSDADAKTKLRRELTREANTAFTFADLMRMAKDHAVRFPKIMTCLNIGCPLGNGIWEGVPLRDVLWLTQPRSDLRLVSYYGYHNDDPAQMFRSSLPAGRVMEDYFGLPPVILCYKLNGQWLTPERGGPVRIVVPEAYGFKSIKWVSHVVLSNHWKANDTYGEQNNDVDSPMKTFCEPLAYPEKAKPNEPFAVTGYAQVGVSGLRKVQVWVHDESKPAEAKRPNFTEAPWVDAKILPPPERWGGGLPDGQIPSHTIGFDTKTGLPTVWPVPLSKAHWAIVIPGLPPGDYTLRCRTIDANGIAQPMPRPFRKSGRAAIAKVDFSVTG